MGGGALMQLIATGSQDIYLTGNPQMTYFRAMYRRHTNFAKESILQNTNGTLTQGSKFSVIIGRHGDLLSNIQLVIKRKTFTVSKAILQLVDSRWKCDGEFFYPSAGYNFLDYVEIEIGGQAIDRHYGDWLNVWTDLTEPIDKKLMLNQLLYGKTRIMPRNQDVYSDGDIYIPLKFWFCNNPGLAIPLIALQYHEIKLNFSLNPSEFGDGDTTAYMDLANSGSISRTSDNKTLPLPELTLYGSGTLQYTVNGSVNTASGDIFQRNSNSSRNNAFGWDASGKSFTNGTVLSGTITKITSNRAVTLKLIEDNCFSENITTVLTEKVIHVSPQTPYTFTASPSKIYLEVINSPVSLEHKIPIIIPKELNIIEELSIYGDYIYLDTEERRKFAKVKHEYLFEQIQTQGPISVSTSNQRESIPLRFNHPIKELVWIIDNTAVSACQSTEQSKRHFEIVKSALLQLNGKDRFSVRPGSYFTLAQRYQHHSGTPLKFLFESIFSGDLQAFNKNWSEFTGSPIPSEAVHVYSFGLTPETNIPSGSCNFSRVDNVVLDLEFFINSSSSSSNSACGKGTLASCYHDPPDYRTVWVFGVNYNVLKIMGGMAGLVYCN